MTVRLAFASLLAVAVIGLAYVHFSVYLEFFSDGPPYYGREENMDKWSDPRPMLIVIDTIFLGIAGISGWRLRARQRRRSQRL
jgi:hypothetical protein